MEWGPLCCWDCKKKARREVMGGIRWQNFERHALERQEREGWEILVFEGFR
jgi:hypothetical protein